MRGIYKLDISLVDFPPLDGDGEEIVYGDVVEIARGSKWLYLHTGTCPHAVEDIGAELVGNTWAAAKRALSAQACNQVFDAEWDDVDGDGKAVVVRGRRGGRKGPVEGLRRDYLVPNGFGSSELKAEQASVNRG